MSSIAISLVACGSIFGGTLLGMYLRRILPEDHLSSGSKDVIRLGIGMLATMAALVLGLLIASAKGTFDTMNSGVRQTGAKIILLDRNLARYGTETREAREILRLTVTDMIERIWPSGKAVSYKQLSMSGIGFGDFEEKVQQLSPRNDDQRRHKLRALELTDEIKETVWQITEQLGQRSIPAAFIVLLICWLAIIFFCFSLFTSPNTTVIIILFICAVSSASSLFLIMGLDQPLKGAITISSVPLRNALALLGH